MKIILSGGGTAGHVNPAIAIAKEIRKINPKNEVLFIGRQGGAENELIANAAFPYTTLKVNGLKRKITLDNVDAIYRAIKAKSEAKKIIKSFSPDAIIGTGGYVCWPVISAGHSLNVPIFIHESNICPGLTTKLLATKCDRVFLCSEDSYSLISPKAKYSVVGNPVQREFFTTKRENSRKRLGLSDDDVLILSFGGSLGAERLNEEIIKTMYAYSAKKKNVVHIHATGKAEFEKYKDVAFTEKSRCKVLPYISEMPTYMTAADIAICRAGAMTLAEISATGTAAILIPSPNVSDNHQYKNASILQEKNAAIVIEEKDLTSDYLTKITDRLASHPNERNRLSKCIELFAKKNVASTILNEVNEVIKKRQNSPFL